MVSPDAFSIPERTPLITISALASYSSSDPTWFQSQPFVHRAANWTGRVGATLAELLLQLRRDVPQVIARSPAVNGLIGILRGIGVHTAEVRVADGTALAID